MSDDPKKNPLWRYMPTMAHAPPPRPIHEPGAPPPRVVEDQDMYLLRVGSEWRPNHILAQFGPARRPSECLPRVLVACAVLQGVHRIYELSDRILALVHHYQPRVRQMVNDEALEARKKVIETLQLKLEAARREIPTTRARAANDRETDPQSPDGLRLLDLRILIEHTEVVVVAHEVSSRRNVVGVDFAHAVAGNPPSMREAEAWLERALGTDELHGILLFWPESYHRVLVVFDDGRLAYDPGTGHPEEEHSGL